MKHKYVNLSKLSKPIKQKIKNQTQEGLTRQGTVASHRTSDRNQRRRLQHIKSNNFHEDTRQKKSAENIAPKTEEKKKKRFREGTVCQILPVIVSFINNH